MSGPPKPQNVPADVDEARAFAAALAERTDATIARAATTFTEDERNQRVNGEWSTVESFRHLVLVADLWLSKAVKGEADPFHPIALPPSFVAPKMPGTSIDPDAKPTFDEACEVLRSRIATLQEYIGSVRRTTWRDPSRTTRRQSPGCLGVLFDEFMAHDSFINRDLDIIEKERA